MRNQEDFKFMVLRQCGSYTELAKRMGFSRQYLYWIFREGVWVKYKKKLAEAMGIDESALKRFE